MARRWTRAALVALIFLGQAGGSMAEVVQVDNAALARMVDEGAVVVDIRTPAEWRATGVVEGSHLLTFFDAQGNHDAPAWLAALEKIAPDGQPVALICASGGRTAAISRFLDQQVGRPGVHNVTGGINAWIGAGKPVVPVEGGQ